LSSRRRHTRFSRDWSSDVCSSDLARNALPVQGIFFGVPTMKQNKTARGISLIQLMILLAVLGVVISLGARWVLGERTASQTHARSEEHTSELQSRENLVCRLLLEK